MRDQDIKKKRGGFVCALKRNYVKKMILGIEDRQK